MHCCMDQGDVPPFNKEGITNSLANDSVTASEQSFVRACGVCFFGWCHSRTRPFLLLLQNETVCVFLKVNSLVPSSGIECALAQTVHKSTHCQVVQNIVLCDQLSLPT